MLTNWLKDQKRLKWHTWWCAERQDAYEKDSLHTAAWEWHASVLCLQCVVEKDLFWTEMNGKAPSRTNKQAFLQETCCSLWRNVHTKPTESSLTLQIPQSAWVQCFSPCVFWLILSVRYVIKGIPFIYFFNTEKKVIF